MGKNPRHEREAHKVWSDLTSDDQRAACAALEDAIHSLDWLKEDGRYVPSAAKFLRERRWENVKPNHHREVEEIHSFTLETLGLPKTINTLTIERREMYSHRYDDLLIIEQENPQLEMSAMELARSCVQTCKSWDRPEHFGKPSIETVFSSTEVLEKWVARALDA